MISTRACAAAGILLAAVVTACGTSDAPPAAQPSPTAPLAHPSPPPGPNGECVFPTKSALASLKKHSDLVVRGTVDHDPERKPADGPVVARSYYRVSVAQVLSGNPPSDEIVVRIGGTQDARIDFPNDEYVLFLYTEFSTSKPNEDVGEVTYELEGGLAGVFPVRDGKVFNECLDMTAANHRMPATGDGQGGDADAFASEVTTL